MDSAEFARVKWDRGRPQRGTAPKGATRAATDRRLRTASLRYTDAQVERIWATDLDHPSFSSSQNLLRRQLFMQTKG
jgi:hypothetical protein